MPCENCGGKIDWIPFNCKYCGGSFCSDCRLPEEHDCKPIFVKWKMYEFKKVRLI